MALSLKTTTEEPEISYPRRTQESLRSSSTWKIPYHPISSQAEGAGCCRGAHETHWKAALSHTELISFPFFNVCRCVAAIKRRWTLGGCVRTVFPCSGRLLTLPAPRRALSSSSPPQHRTAFTSPSGNHRTTHLQHSDNTYFPRLLWQFYDLIVGSPF